MKYKKVETCTSVIFHLSKMLDVNEFARILINERGYKKLGTIGTNLELSKEDLYIILGKKTIVVEGENEEELSFLESLLKDL